MYEGFIEVIEMGELTGASAVATLINEDQPNPNCSILEQAWTQFSDNSYWIDNPDYELLPPTGGLMGKVELINVSRGTAISESATALNNFSEQILHYIPGSNFPNLANSTNKATIINSNGEAIRTEWATGYEAVSAVLMKTEIFNEYVLNPTIGAQTDWIMSLPTRHFHTSNLEPIAPFNQAGTQSTNCEAIELAGLYDREEQAQNPYDEIIVGTPPPLYAIKQPHLCYSVNILELTDYEVAYTSDVGIFSSNYPVIDYRLGSIIGFQLDTEKGVGYGSYFSEGWAKLDLTTDNHNLTSINDNVAIHGLPVIGFATQQYTNSSFDNGVLANYAGNFEHKSKTEITSVSSPNDLNSLEGMKLSNNNQGQVLIYPYYTVRNGLNTLISIGNPTEEVKAIKVRFREGNNSRTVFSFNLYLSAFDVWTAALVPTVSTIDPHIGEDNVKLLSIDNSCTVPSSLHAMEFKSTFFSNEWSDGLGENLSRTTEGFIEVIEMGSLQGTDAVVATHDSNGVPNACERLVENWQNNNQWQTDPTTNLSFNPDSYIYGSLSLINVLNGTNFSYDATAINLISNEIEHTAPDSELPNLASGNLTTTLIDTADGTFQTTWNSPVDAVSALFMKSEVVNDFSIEENIGAQSAWVNIYPTKQFYVDPLYSGSQEPIQPFSSILSSDSRACEAFYAKAFDRNQQVNSNNIFIYPDPPPPDLVYNSQNCWPVSVTNINSNPTNQSLFGSSLDVEYGLLDIYTPLNWLESSSGFVEKHFFDVGINQTKLTGIGPNGETHELYGKPVLGFMAQKYINGTLLDQNNNNVLANYAVINKNKFKRKIVVTNIN
jgi:hypothetical protein